MLQRLLSRISPIVWLTLFLIGSIFYLWRLQQPQALVEVAAEALPLQKSLQLLKQKLLQVRIFKKTKNVAQ